MNMTAQMAALMVTSVVGLVTRLPWTSPLSPDGKLPISDVQGAPSSPETSVLSRTMQLSQQQRWPNGSDLSESFQNRSAPSSRSLLPRVIRTHEATHASLSMRARRCCLLQTSRLHLSIPDHAPTNTYLLDILSPHPGVPASHQLIDHSVRACAIPSAGGSC
jgi:hypothetical protein